VAAINGPRVAIVTKTVAESGKKIVPLAALAVKPKTTQLNKKARKRYNAMLPDFDPSSVSEELIL
jgi:hypothetical protein